MFVGILLLVAASSQLQPTPVAKNPPPVKAIPWGGSDFIQYYVTSRLLLNDQNPYDRSLSEEQQKQLGRDNWLPTYGTPWSLIPALPSGAMSFEQAVKANLVINGLLLLLCFLAWVNLLLPKNKEHYLMLAPTVLLWVPTVYLLGMGQNSLWVLMGFTGWLWCITRRRLVLAGLFLVLCTIKPHIGLLTVIFAVVHCLRHRHWSTLWAFSLGLLFVSGFLSWLRPTIWTDYLTALQSGTSPTSFYTATLNGWLRVHWGESFGYLSWVLWVIVLIVTAVVAWRGINCGMSALRTSDDSPEQKSLINWSILICMASIVFVPYAFTYDFVILLPGYLLAVCMALLRTDKRWPIVLIIWIGMVAWLMYGKSNQWQESAYGLIPWAGLASTCWVMYWPPHSYFSLKAVVKDQAR